MSQPKLSDIKTIVIVMLENRSFDHMLGYLSLQNWGRSEVEGLKDDPAWMRSIGSSYNGASFPPWHSTDPFAPLPADPPHERPEIAVQLGKKANGRYAMDGFVTNYASKWPVKPGERPAVMSYFAEREVPITHFLAENFALCDHWFSSLPAGTQPNRLMSMAGFSRIDLNSSLLLPDHHLLYDWLNERKIRWRVYHEGMPFFSMMPRWIGAVVDDHDHFRRFNRLDDDLMEGLPDELPQVFFMEPSYTDAPHIGPSSDDHAPSGAKAGQEFLMKVYKAFATLNPDLWAQTVMMVTYDEHGGFFDHVPPVALTTAAPSGATYPTFYTSGVRVPSFVVSPFVKEGTIFSKLLDHTSILKFVGEVFNRGSYSTDVDARPVGSVFDVLNLDSPRDSVRAPTNLVEYLNRAVPPVGYTPGKAPHNEIAHSFKKALDKMKAHSPHQTAAKYGDVLGPFLAT